MILSTDLNGYYVYCWQVLIVKMASSAGFEPTTSPLGGAHSIQLSYEDL